MIRNFKRIVTFIVALMLLALPVSALAATDATTPVASPTSEALTMDVMTTAETFVAAEPAALEAGEEPQIAAPVTFIVKDKISKAPLENVEFKLYSSSGLVLRFLRDNNGEWALNDNGTEALKSDKDGKIVISGLAPGAYTLKNSKAAPTYALSSAVLNISATTTAATGDTEYLCEPLSLELTVTDSYSDKPLAGAEFTITDKDGKVVTVKEQSNGEWYADEKGVNAAKSDKDGKIIIRYLVEGEQSITATAITGYALPKALKVTLAKENGASKPIKSTVKFAPIKMIFEKYDGYANTLITQTSATPPAFKLLDKDGNIVRLKKDGGYYRPDSSGQDTFTYDATGRAELLYLSTGNYSIEETVPPVGFSKSANFSVEIKSEHTFDAPLTVKMYDEPIVFRLNMTDSSGKALSGAGFQLLPKGSTVPLAFTSINGIYKVESGGTTSTIMLGESGEAYIYYLPAGDYTLVQTVVPKGVFAIAPQSITVTTENNITKPADFKATSDKSVQLGYDTDWYYLPLAITIIVLAAGASLLVLRKLRSRNQEA